MDKTPTTRTFAIEREGSAFRVHSDRALIPDGRGYTSVRSEQTFPSEEVARKHAVEVLGAVPADIAPDQGVA